MGPRANGGTDVLQGKLGNSNNLYLATYNRANRAHRSMGPMAAVAAHDDAHVPGHVIGGGVAGGRVRRPPPVRPAARPFVRPSSFVRPFVRVVPSCARPS